MVFITYFRFIFINLAKKWSTWIFAVLYFIFAFVFLYVVPTIAKADPWYLWQNTLVAPQMMLMYIAAIYGSIISISIFKDYRDNGTELLLISKPIARGKVIVAKFLLLIVFDIVFALAACLVGLVIFSFPDSTAYLVFSLMVSIFISTFLVMFILSIFATIISLFANKVWTILVTIVLVVVFTILSTVSNLAIKTPAGLAKEEGHAIISSNYLGRDGKEHSVGALSPFSINSSESSKIYFSNVDEEREFWHKYESRSGVKIIDALDIMGQFQNMNNMLELENVLTDKASAFFGENHWFDYEFDDKSIVEHDEAEPMFYVQMATTESTLLPEIRNISDFFLGENAKINQAKLVSAILNFISGERIIMLGKTSADVSSILTPFTLKQFHVVENHDGWMGARNNLENKNYDDIAVTPYSGSPIDKLFRAMLNAQLGIKQDGDPISNPNARYQFTDLNDPKGSALHILNTCNYYWQLDEFNNFVDAGDDDITATLYDSLESLFVPRLNPDVALKIEADDTSYSNLFDTAYDYTSYFSDKINKAMDFPHFCFVGANNGKIGSSSLNQTFKIKDPDDLSKNLELQGKLIPDTSNSNVASKQLMDLMAQYKLFAFEYLTNVIKTSETNGNIYKAAYNTPLIVDGTDFGVDANLNFNSSPLLPIKVNADDKYTYMDSSLPSPFAEVQQIFALLFAICPNLFTDQWIQILINSGVIQWKDNWNNPYFYDPKVLNARAFLDWFISDQRYGWESATDPLDTNMIQSYVTNLVTNNESSSGVNNFPVVYENLSTPFTTKPYYEPWEIAIVWFAIGIMLSAATVLIYMRSDFK